MQRLEVSGAVRPIYGSLGVKRLIKDYFTGGVENLDYVIILLISAKEFLRFLNSCNLSRRNTHMTVTAVCDREQLTFEIKFESATSEQTCPE